MPRHEAELYILAFPELDSENAALLRSLRAEHCPADQIDLPPHVAIAFALPVEMRDEVTLHISGFAASNPAFDIALDSLDHEPGGIVDSNHYLFLKPGRGRDLLIQVHEELARLLPEIPRRMLKPFDPHVTIGIFSDGEACESLMRELRERPWDVRGRVSSLSILELPGNRILQRFPLIGGDSA